jgi:alpha-tubulin suppressor-like RCC1 family protein
MRSTRRLLSRYSSVAAALVTCLATVGAVASCSSNDDEHGTLAPDAAPEASPPNDAGVDAVGDARPRDAGTFDGGPLPVVCESAPCAKSLVTTLGADESDRGEGFCALLEDGTVACWGADAAGQLGRGEEAGAQDSAMAARVVGLADVVTLHHTCAVDKSGAAYCWGTGPYLHSEWGPTSTERTPVKLPIPPATHVGTSSSTGCAAVESGILCWGMNTFGQIKKFDVASLFTVFPPQAIPVPPGAPIRELVVGSASFVLREDGTAVSWGANPPLGRVSPLFPDPYPQLVVLNGISNMDVASDNACAAAGGIGYCWGAVVKDMYTVIAPTDRALPEPIVAPEPIVQVATTRTVSQSDWGVSSVQPQRWCACAASGAVYCAGYNASGQAGDGTKDFALEAVQVVGLPGPAAQVKTTPDATCALLTNGKVYCWGSNFYGQLGSGKLKAQSAVPQEVVLP